MESIRSFIAVEIPDSLKSRLAETIKALHALNPFIRWVRPESVHLTLKFLGNIEQSMIEPVTVCIKESVKGLQPFRVTAGGAGVFPDVRRPRVLWVGLTEGQEQLSLIHRRLEESLEALGFAPESRPLRAHLTLGRFKDTGKTGKLIGREILENAAPWKESFTVNGVNLIRSELHPSGAVYTLLKECLLTE